MPEKNANVEEVAQLIIATDKQVNKNCNNKSYVTQKKQIGMKNSFEI